MENIIGGATAEPVGGETIKDTTTASFTADVLDASREVPVIVDFWAPWCGPCKQLGPVLEKVVKEARGAVRLVKLNIDAEPEIAQQLRIQSIPAVFAFHDGRPFDGFVGALPESQIRAFVDRLTDAAKGRGQDQDPAMDEALDQARQALGAGDLDTAGALFAQLHERDPTLAAAIAGLARCLLARGETEQAWRLLDGAPDGAAKDPEVEAARAALELAGQGVDAGRLPALEAALRENPNDHQARLGLAMAHYGAGRREQAVEGLLEIVRRGNQWNEGAARKQLLKLFEAFGPTDPLTVESRRQLSAILFS